VRERQILAHLDDTQARANTGARRGTAASARKAAAEDEARVQQAELTLQRRQQLMKEGVIGKAELDQSQSDVDSLKARIAYTLQQIGVAEQQ
jgi:multidrug resistance efflux pump